MMPQRIQRRLGIPTASFHWWKNKLSLGSQKWVRQNAYWWLPLSVVLFFIYAVGPDIERRAVAPVSAPVSQDTGCFGGCPKYVGSPLGWDWTLGAVEVELPPAAVGASPRIAGYHVFGKNVSDNFIQLKDAYLESRVDGTKVPLQVFTLGSTEKIAVSDTNPVPPHAPFVLGTQLYTQNPLSEADFFQKWRSFIVVIKYDDQTVTHNYDQADLQSIIDAQNPSGGPHVTKRAP